jgi:hypothetical protein
MVASIDLQILLRLRPYPMRGHRLLCCSNNADTTMQELLGIEWEKDFVGLGLDEEVPKFLRTNAKIKNRHMSKVS